MRRGDFPYAHLDLMLTAEGRCLLLEIKLRRDSKNQKRKNTVKYHLRHSSYYNQHKT